MRSHEGEGPKQFEVGFRGYRREPVDEYVERLHQWLLDSEARAEHAVEAATEAVGEKAAEILRAALAVGEQANQDAEAVKAAAVETASSEAEAMMEDAHRQIDALQQTIDSLAVRKANVLSELGRLQKYLAGASPDGSPKSAAPTEADVDDEVVEERAITAEPDAPVNSKNGHQPQVAR